VLEITLGVDYCGGVTEDDLRTMLREFRTSVAADLDAQHRRIAQFVEESRRRFTQLDERVAQLDERIRIAETAILNEIRAMSDRIDRRIERLEGQ
jgi:hypothetical protein